MDFTDAISHILEDKLLLYATPVFLLMLSLEYWVDKRDKLGLYENKDMLTSMAMGIFSLIVEFFPKVIFYLIFFYIYQVDYLGMNTLMSRVNWWAWVIIFTLEYQIIFEIFLLVYQNQKQKDLRNQNFNLTIKEVAA